MAAKRHVPPTVTSNLTAASAERKRSRPACDALTIDALPAEVLAEIFKYAPLSARLKAISLVCGRWRAVALSVYDTIIVHSPLALSVPRLAAALSLLPCVTSMEISVPVAHFALPSSLRKLSVSNTYLQIAKEAADGGLSTFLTQRFPNLTELNVTHVDHDATSIDITGFLAAHGDRLASLTLDVDEDCARLLLKCSSSLRALRQLTFVDPPAHGVDALIRSIPSLQELSLDYLPPSQFLDMPDDCVTALTRLRLGPGPLPACLNRLLLCPNLKDLTLDYDFDVDHIYVQFSDLLARTYASVSIAEQRWAWLGQFRRLSTLNLPLHHFHIAPERTPLLPNLRTVTIGRGDADERLDASTAILMAHCVLNALPQVTRIELFVTVPEVEGLRLSSCLEALVRAATHCHLRELVFYADRSLAAIVTLPEAKLGWIKVIFAS